MEVYIWTKEEEVSVAPWLCKDGLVCCRVDLHLYRGDKSLQLVRLSVCLSRVYDMLEIGHIMQVSSNFTEWLSGVNSQRTCFN